MKPPYSSQDGHRTCEWKVMSAGVFSLPARHYRLSKKAKLCRLTGAL
jgi:hypothetical protein